MTVYYERDHDMKLPLVPIVQNCAVPPLIGAVAPVTARKLAYEPVYPWITGMAVAHWETQPDKTSSAAAEEHARREESLA
jgi:hypothetical protein